jgi:hypothetical protein
MRRPQQWTYLKRQHADNLSKRTEYIALASLRMLDLLDADLTPGERHDLASAMREARARIALFRAYGRLNQDDYVGTRRSALQCLHGPLSVSLRGAALIVSPRAWQLLAALRRRLT